MYDKADGEVLLISTETGEQRSIMAEKGAKQIAFGLDKLYLINSDNRLFSASLDDGSFAEDNRFQQVLDMKLSDNHETAFSVPTALHGKSCVCQLTKECEKRRNSASPIFRNLPVSAGCKRRTNTRLK